MHSAQPGLLQLSVYPMGFLQSSIHPVTSSLCSMLPSVHSLPLHQPAGSCDAARFGEGPCSGPGKLLCAQRAPEHPMKQMLIMGKQEGR